jgi:CPA2 family monovalent cation:H+ antiporter-2
VGILSMTIKLSGYSMSTSLTAGIALAQIGEFAFVLAAHGKHLGLVSNLLHKLLLHITVVSLVLTPFLIRATPWVVGGWGQNTRCVDEIIGIDVIPDVEAKQDKV